MSEKLRAFADYMELFNENQELKVKVTELESRLLKVERDIGNLKHTEEIMASAARGRYLNSRKMGM